MGKSLEGMPVFTVRELEDHKESEKNGAITEKTREAFNLKMNAI